MRGDAYLCVRVSVVWLCVCVKVCRRATQSESRGAINQCDPQDRLRSSVSVAPELWREVGRPCGGSGVPGVLPGAGRAAKPKHIIRVNLFCIRRSGRSAALV